MEEGACQELQNRCLLSAWILFPDTCMRNGGGGEAKDMWPARAEQAPFCQALP